MATPLTEGDTFFCQHCQARSIVKKKREYVDFSLKRELLVCAFCQKEIAVAAAAETSSVTAAAPRPNALAALLGVEDEPLNPDAASILQAEQERRFCKNCAYNFVTPFKCHCTLHRREVEPMQDCPDYAPKEPRAKL